MMKKFYSVFIVLLVTVTTWSQTRSWNGGNGDWNDKTKWTPVGVPVENDILEFNGISATVSNVPSTAFRGIIISGGDIILNGAAGNTKTLTIGQETAEASLSIQADANLTIGNNLDIVLAKNSFAAVDGTLIVTNNRQYYTNAEGTTKTVVNGVIKNNGGTILSNAAGLEFGDGAIYEHSRDQGTIPAATWSKNSTCTITGILSKAPQGIGQTFGNYTWNCAHQTAGALLGDAIPSVINGNLTIQTTSTGNDPAIYVQVSDKVQIGGSLIINGGICRTKTATSTIDIGGDFIMTGGVLKAGAATGPATININFAGNAKQNFIKSAGSLEKSDPANAKSEIKFTVLDKAIVDFGETVLKGDMSFNVAAGATLLTAHPEGLSSTGLTGSIQVTGTRTYSSDADYAYTGTTHQVTGLGLPAVVRRLIINNSAGMQAGEGVTLSKAVAVNSELILLNGFLQTSATSILVIMDGGKATTDNESFVAGPMQKKGSAAFTFPTGWAGSGGGLIPIGISSINTSSLIQAEYKRAPATNKGATINAPLDHISYCEYWELFPVSGNPTAIITMYRNAHSNCNPMSSVQDFFTFRVARSDGKAWTQIGNADGTMSSGSGYVVSDSTGTAINKTAKYFSLGNISSARDPLPVFFDSVVAYEKNGAVNVEWNNLTERDMATYFVERSVNGKDYTIISQHLPKSNKDDKASYISIDKSPAGGTNYYRIKAIEKNTKIIFSRIMRVETDMPEQSFSLYPNPVRGTQLSINFSGIKEGECQLRLVNSTGQAIFQKKINTLGSFTTQSLELPSTIRAGIYNVVITGTNYRFSKIFIVQ